MGKLWETVGSLTYNPNLQHKPEAFSGVLLSCWSPILGDNAPSLQPRPKVGLKASKGLKAKRQKARDNTLSQIHRNSALRKGKSITINNVEIKIVITLVLPVS